MFSEGIPDLRVQQSTLEILTRRLAEASARVESPQATLAAADGFDPRVIDAVEGAIYLFQQSAEALAQQAASLRDLVTNVASDMAATDRQLAGAR